MNEPSGAAVVTAAVGQGAPTVLGMAGLLPPRGELPVPRRHVAAREKEVGVTAAREEQARRREEAAEQGFVLLGARFRGRDHDAAPPGQWLDEAAARAGGVHDGHAADVQPLQRAGEVARGQVGAGEVQSGLAAAVAAVADEHHQDVIVGSGTRGYAGQGGQHIVARGAGAPGAALAEHVKVGGRHTRPAGGLRDLPRRCGIGRGLRVKVNANVGSSRDRADVSLEIEAE